MIFCSKELINDAQLVVNTYYEIHVLSKWTFSVACFSEGPCSRTCRMLSTLCFHGGTGAPDGEGATAGGDDSSSRYCEFLTGSKAVKPHLSIQGVFFFFFYF